MKKLLLIACFAPLAVAANTPIQGTVESKCVIQTDTTGVYGNPSPSELSTSASDGGVVPIVRYDILAADHYKAVIFLPPILSPLAQSLQMLPTGQVMSQ